MEQRVRFSEKISYAALNFGMTVTSMFISTYILYYYTDVLLLPAAAASVLLLFGRLFDGAVDPFIGHYMDRRQSGNGKFKGYLARWTPLLMIFGIMLFVPLPFSKGICTAICFILYIIWSICYSMVESATAALSVSLSADMQQRQRVITFRMVASVFAALVVTYFALPVVGYLGQGDEIRGYFLAMALFSVAAALLAIPCIITARERNYKETNRYTIWQCLAVLAKNKELLLFLLMYMLNQIASALKNQMAIYHFKYAFNRMELLPLFFLFGRIASLAAQPFIVIFSKKIKINHLIIGGYVLAGIPMLALLLIPPTPAAVIAMCSIGSLFSAFPANLAFSYSAQIADEISKGSDSSFSGIVSSMTGLANKIGSAVGGAAVAGILALLNYAPNTQLPAEVLAGIETTFIILSGVMYILSGVCAVLMTKAKRSGAEL